MPDYVVCTRAIRGGSFPCEPGPTRILKVSDQREPTPSHEVNRWASIGELKTPTLPSSQEARRPHPSHHHATPNSAPSQCCPEFMLQHAKPPSKPHRNTSRKLKLELQPSPQATANCNQPRIVAYHRTTNLPAPSNTKLTGDAPRASRVGLPESAPAKAVGVNCGARFLKNHPTTNPVVDPISHGRYFDDPAFLKDLTYTLAGDMDQSLTPRRKTTFSLSLTER